MAINYLVLIGYLIFIPGAIFSFFMILRDSRKDFLKQVSKNKYFLLILIALIIVLFSLPFFIPIFNSESQIYQSQAKCILDRVFLKTPEYEEYCTFWLFSGDHELTFPIFISLVRILLPSDMYDFGLRVLVFCFNLLTSLFIFFFISRRKGPVVALFASLLIYTMPYYLIFVFNILSESLYLMIFFSIIFISDYVKIKNLPYFFFMISLLALTRIEMVLILPLIGAYIMATKDITPDLKNKSIRKSFFLCLLVFALFGFFFILSSRLRVYDQGKLFVSAFSFIPLYLSTSLAFILFNHKQKKICCFSGFVYFFALFLYSFTRIVKNEHYFFSSYVQRFFAYWIPEIIRQITEFSPFVLYSFLAFFIFFVIRVALFAFGKKNMRETKLLSEIIFFSLFSLSVLNILSFLEPYDLDSRFVSVSILFFVIPISLSIPRFRKRIPRLMVIISTISVTLVIITFLFYQGLKYPPYFNNNSVFDDVALRMTEDIPVVFLHVTNIELIFLRTERTFFLIRIWQVDAYPGDVEERLNSLDRFYFLDFQPTAPQASSFPEQRSRFNSMVDMFDKEEIYSNELFILYIAENSGRLSANQNE
ncbi:MAG TPA: hypothetical protein ENN46_00745 [Candidatus Woesearchaeota archaeon]|nr:hypothetical protein [Candidatus Woesearchaeota archaeon]